MDQIHKPKTIPDKRLDIEEESARIYTQEEIDMWDCPDIGCSGISIGDCEED